MRKYLSRYEKSFDYNNITEKILDREKEIEELKFIRSLLDKKMKIEVTE
jgi:hypothetical protein